MLRAGSHVGIHFAYHWLPWKLLDSVLKVEREREREREREKRRRRKRQSFVWREREKREGGGRDRALSGCDESM